MDAGKGAEAVLDDVHVHLFDVGEEGALVVRIGGHGQMSQVDSFVLVLEEPCPGKTPPGSDEGVVVDRVGTSEPPEDTGQKSPNGERPDEKRNARGIAIVVVYADCKPNSVHLGAESHDPGSVDVAVSGRHLDGEVGGEEFAHPLRK